VAVDDLGAGSNPNLVCRGHSLNAAAGDEHSSIRDQPSCDYVNDCDVLDRQSRMVLSSGTRGG
jgi:hypothetical protein